MPNNTRNRDRRQRMMAITARSYEPVKVARSLTSSQRTFRRQVPLTLGSWQSDAGFQYSGDLQLNFKLSEFTTDIAALGKVWDQVRVRNVRYTITKMFNFASGGGTSATAQSILLYSSYDTDGGVLSDPLEILSRRNLKVNVLTLNKPSCTLAGTPAMTNTDGRVIYQPTFDLANTIGLKKDFFSHQLVAVGVNQSIGNDQTLHCLVEVDVDMIGAR